MEPFLERIFGDYPDLYYVTALGAGNLPPNVEVTEYGIADLRGKSDKDVIGELLKVTDSRFQDELLSQAKQAGKIPADYEIARAFRNNTPEHLSRTLERYRNKGYFPAFPFGSDFTPEESETPNMSEDNEKRSLRTLTPSQLVVWAEDNTQVMRLQSGRDLLPGGYLVRPCCSYQNGRKVALTCRSTTDHT